MQLQRLLLFMASLMYVSVADSLPDTADKPGFHLESVYTIDGNTLGKATISSPPRPPQNMIRPTLSMRQIDAQKASATSRILTVPAYEWSFGCAPTAAAMIAAYYDRNGYYKLYTGPTNNGLAPMDNSVWPRWTDSHGDNYAQCPISATHKGLDGRTALGHVDDYWVQYNDNGPDPYQKSGRFQHRYETCVGDYMRSNQAVNYYDSSQYGNPDGATTFYFFRDGKPLTASDMVRYGVHVQDGAYGFKRFIEARGYKVSALYTQQIDTVQSGGFSFAQYRAEIDAGRPVFIHLQGHTMTGIGYNLNGNKIYVHDTWDHQIHEMVWGGSYGDLAQWGVSVVHLQPIQHKTTPDSFYIIPLPNRTNVIINL